MTKDQALKHFAGEISKGYVLAVHTGESKMRLRQRFDSDGKELFKAFTPKQFKRAKLYGWKQVNTTLPKPVAKKENTKPETAEETKPETKTTAKKATKKSE